MIDVELADGGCGGVETVASIGVIWMSIDEDAAVVDIGDVDGELESTDEDAEVGSGDVYGEIDCEGDIEEADGELSDGLKEESRCGVEETGGRTAQFIAACVELCCKGLTNDNAESIDTESGGEGKIDVENGNGRCTGEEEEAGENGGEADCR